MPGPVRDRAASYDDAAFLYGQVVGSRLFGVKFKFGGSLSQRVRKSGLTGSRMSRLGLARCFGEFEACWAEAPSDLAQGGQRM